MLAWGSPRQRRQERAREVVDESCCGLDVHATTVVACVSKKGRRELRAFATMPEELLRLGEWLAPGGCTQVASARTGVYGKPVFNPLAGTGEVIPVNARPIKAVPGRKTEGRDCEGGAAG